MIVFMVADTWIVLWVYEQKLCLLSWYLIMRPIALVHRWVWVSLSRFCTSYVWIYLNVKSSLSTSLSWEYFIQGFWQRGLIICPSIICSIPILSRVSALLIFRIIIATQPSPSAFSASSMFCTAYLVRLLCFLASTSLLPPAARFTHDTFSP